MATAKKKPAAKKVAAKKTVAKKAAAPAKKAAAVKKVAAKHSFFNPDRLDAGWESRKVPAGRLHSPEEVLQPGVSFFPGGSVRGACGFRTL